VALALARFALTAGASAIADADPNAAGASLHMISQRHALFFATTCRLENCYSFEHRHTILPMSEIAVATTIAVLIWALGLSAFLYGLRVRWFGRFVHGFFLSLMIAIIGIAILATSVIGIWGYLAARRSINQELIMAMGDVGGIVEAQVAAELRQVGFQLGRFTTSVAPLLTKMQPGELRERLKALQNLNPHFLQVRVLDGDGKLMVASDDNLREPINRTAVGYALDGKAYISEAMFSKPYDTQVMFISTPIRNGEGPIIGVVTALIDMRAALTDLIGTVKFNLSGYAVVVDGEGQILAHPDRSRLDENVSGYPAVQLARQTRTVGHVVADNSKGERKLFVYRPVTNPSTTGRDPWVLLTEINYGEEMQTLMQLRRELILGGVILILGSLLIAQQLSDSIRKPLYQLRDFAERIGGGDLSTHTPISGKDVAGALGRSLNHMVDGLRERDRVKEVFGRYIATQVSDKILSGQVNLGGEAKVVTILFSDIRNFTGISEKLTPQQVVTFLNSYFSEMVEAVFEQGGVLDKFIGDGLMAVFGSLDDQPDHPRRAVLAALRMKALLGKINGERSVAGKPPFGIGIGIHTDEVIVGNIGSSKRLEYTVVGDGVNAASRTQGLNKEFGTTILITETTYEAIKNEFDCKLMPEHALRGKEKSLRFYEVVSARGH
jgi:adenylate cyclase